jgi:hypothetical protein
VLPVIVVVVVEMSGPRSVVPFEGDEITASAVATAVARVEALIALQDILNAKMEMEGEDADISAYYSDACALKFYMRPLN